MPVKYYAVVTFGRTMDLLIDTTGLQALDLAQIRIVYGDDGDPDQRVGDWAIRDGLVLCESQADGAIHRAGLTPAEFADLAADGCRMLAVDPYDCDGNLRANLDPRILAAHVKQTPVARVGVAHAS